MGKKLSIALSNAAVSDILNINNLLIIDEFLYRLSYQKNVGIDIDIDIDIFESLPCLNIRPDQRGGVFSGDGIFVGNGSIFGVS